jgi:hypothetical protein
MSEGEQFIPDSADGISVYLRMQWDATEAVTKFTEASKRPVRHNQRIERAALWHVLSLDEDCARILDPAGWPHLVRPKTGVTRSRYEAEAAIRTIPELVPFTPQESDTLRYNQHLHNFQFEHGIGDVARGQLALCERWHEWLWTAGSSARAQVRNPESKVLEVGCARLSVALGDVIATYQAERPIQGEEPQSSETPS